MKKNTKIVIAIVTVTIAIIPVLFIGLIFFGMKKNFVVQDSGCEGVTILSNPVLYDKYKRKDSESFFGKGNGKIYRVALGAWEEKICVPIDNADYDTFEVLSKYHAKDKNNAYLQDNNIRKDAEEKQYTIFGIDNATFKLLDSKGKFTKDGNNIYFQVYILKDADPKTFKILDEDLSYSTDGKYIYYDFYRVEGADPETFEILGKHYARDADNIFYLERRVDGADSTSFLINHSGGTYDASDKNNKYYGGFLEGDTMEFGDMQDRVF